MPETLPTLAMQPLRRLIMPGTTRWIVDRERRIVVGCTITGAEVADFLHAATIAIVGEVPLDRLWHAVPAYPTMNEIWLRLLETYGRPAD